MIFHALVSAGDITAQCAPQVAGQSPTWLQVIQATGSIATAVGVLIALYIAVIRDPREASEEHRHHLAQMEAIHRVKVERFGAQARKLVPTCVRTPMLGDSWWIVRVDNIGHAAVTVLGIKVAAIDSSGIEIPGGCRRSSIATAPDEPALGSIPEALSESLESKLEGPLSRVARQAIQRAVAVHFVEDWPRFLPPNQHAAMAYTTTDPDYLLRITIDYEDEAGFQWQRTDTDQPRRTDTSVGVDPATTVEPGWLLRSFR